MFSVQVNDLLKELLKFTNLDYKSILRNNLDAMKQDIDESDERLQWFRKKIEDN